MTEQDSMGSKKGRALERQRQRRRRLHRIDYYASPEAAAIIDAQLGPCAGSDASSIINRILVEWAALRVPRQAVR
jgi:hypothetical protein